MAWHERFQSAEEHLQADRLDETAQGIDALKQLLTDAEDLGEEHSAQLKALETQLTDRRNVLAAEFRKKKLAEAAELVNAGKLDEATRALDDVLSRAPDDTQRQTAGELKDRIERVRRARRRLGSWVKLLGSKTRSEVRAAQNELSRDPDTSLPLLMELARNTENPLLVGNTLELLGRLRRPEVTLPAMVGVLKRIEQKPNWPDAIREIGKSNSPGAGEPLLELVLSSSDAEQRTAAARALSRVSDPPRRTLTALLPLIHTNGPELPAVLQACVQAVHVHHQHDLTARRGLNVTLSDEQSDSLAQLPARLQQIIQSGSQSESDSNSAAAYAARILSIATRQSPPQLLTGLKVIDFSGEYAEGPAAAVLDGVWNSTELKTMWYCPIDRKGSILLDLGTERTVIGVRIWNFNQPGGTHRGWKEVNVFVSNSKTEVTPAARGLLPVAPGAANTPDYSTTVPVEFVRGRYVKLKAAAVWRPDSYSGLAEIQVFGF